MLVSVLNSPWFALTVSNITLKFKGLGDLDIATINTIAEISMDFQNENRLSDSVLTVVFLF